MTGRDKIAKDLGALLAENAGPDKLEERLAAQKARVVSLVTAGQGRRRRSSAPFFRTAAMGTAAAAAACFAVWMAYHFADDESIAFFKTGTQVALSEGYFIQTGETAESIQFDGGHRFGFGKNTKARVVRAGSRQVIVDLEQGDVRADVVPGSGIAWTIRAGAYQVVVKGTVFSVNWDDSAAVLSVSVDRGKVAVLGPGIDEDGVAVSAGSSLRADAFKGQITVNQNRLEESVELGDLKSSLMDTESSSNGLSAEQTEIAAGGKAGPSPSEWKKLYAERNFQGIMELAEKKGVENIKRRLAKDELWIVANSARYVRNNRLADELFQVFRLRFPGANQSQTAAFLLAKFAVESGRSADAVRWFETYLEESPSGPLAEEALGRLMNVYSKLGNSPKAVEAAERYLQKYSGGYFSKQAGNILHK